MTVGDSMIDSLKEFGFRSQTVAGSVLAKIQAFIMNCCFVRLIELILIQSAAMN